jgi:hypothetical protein
MNNLVESAENLLERRVLHIHSERRKNFSKLSVFLKLSSKKGNSLAKLKSIRERNNIS